jgi:hypothetical protein
MLKRLQTTKATKDLQRDKLLTNYNTTMIAGHQLAGVHPTASSSKLNPYQSRSATNLGSAASEFGGRRTRPGSAKSTTSTMSVRSVRSRPQSGKRQAAAAAGAGAAGGRPEWESGW